jgi:hypothetical protein
MPATKWKKPNTLKHGIFSPILIIPGEDPEDFKQLFLQVAEEWMPDGATERDAALCIAKAMWLKRRLQRFIEVQFTMNMADPNHPGYDEAMGLGGFAALIRLNPARLNPEAAFDEYARCLRPSRISYLRRKFPRSEFLSDSEWAQAIANEITSMLVPEIMGHSDEDEPHLAMMQSAGAFSNELFDRELALDERLNAMIDRATKRLIHIKAMKEMLRQTSAAPEGEQPNKISARSALR